MEECEVCGAKITRKNPQTKPCPRCERVRCESCDMGSGTVCVECEAEDDDEPT